MDVINWISGTYIEIFGVIAGILYVFLEIRQNIWLWPVGIITSAVYIYVFFTGKLYAEMSLQGYYLVISVIGWYWWTKGTGQKSGSLGAKRRSSATAEGDDLIRNDISEAVDDNEIKLKVTRVKPVTAIILGIVFFVLYATIWIVLDRFTDSPVPAFDSFITSLSIVATWMLARKIYEHWFLWIVVNFSASILFFTRELYPTVILYIVYCVMSFAGLIEWKKSLKPNT